MLVDNRPGGGRKHRADHVPKAPGDATLAHHDTPASRSAPASTRTSVRRDEGFRAGDAASPLLRGARDNPQIPAASVKELNPLARSRPGAINYGFHGIGAPPHLWASC